MRKILSLALGFVVVIALGATGQEGEGKKKPAGAAPAGNGLHLTLKALDADADGIISKEEWMAVFTKLNANGDHGLSEAEFNAGSAAYPCNGQPGAAKKRAGGDGK